MGEQRTRREQQRTGAAGSPGGSDNPLKTGKGDTTIQNTVVTKVAGIAAGEVDGIRLGGGSSQAVSGILGNIPGVGGGQTSGVSVEAGQEEAAVDLTISTAYGKPIPQLAEAVRKNVISRVEGLTGLKVTEVNVTVSSIFFPEEEAEKQRRKELQQQQG